MFGPIRYLDLAVSALSSLISLVHGMPHPRPPGRCGHVPWKALNMFPTLHLNHPSPRFPVGRQCSGCTYTRCADGNFRWVHVLPSLRYHLAECAERLRVPSTLQPRCCSDTTTGGGGTGGRFSAGSNNQGERRRLQGVIARAHDNRPLMCLIFL